MNKTLERKVSELEKVNAEEEIKSLERMNFRLSDAIREGSKVSDQAFNWTDENDNLCALSAAVVSAKARKYL